MALREFTSDGDRTRPLYKKKNYKMRMEKEGLEPALVLGGSSLHGFVSRFARRCFSRCGLGNDLDKGGGWGHPRFAKNSGGNGLAKLGIPSRTSRWYPQMLCLNTQHPYP